MKRTIPEYYAVMERLNARAFAITQQVLGAVRGDSTRLEPAVAAHLMLAAQQLVGALDDISWNLASSDVDLGKHPNVKPKTSLAEVQAAQKAILKAWNVIGFYGPEALNRSMPEYFAYLLPLAEGLLNTVEDRLSASAGSHPSGDAALADLAYRVGSQSDKVIRLLQGQVKKSRGARRGRLTFAISLLDDANKLAEMGTRKAPPFGKADGDYGESPDPLDDALKQVDAQLMAGPVRDATMAVLLPIAEQLYAKANEVCPDVAVAAQQQIAWLE